MFAQMILASNHFVGFTGAGISTACGIADYRSGYNTVMPTGPGGWETAANKAKYESEQKKLNQPRVTIPMKKAIPSLTHMAMVELIDRGHLKYIVSQNVDGLHRRSGVPPECISEVHGNTNCEMCEQCDQEYMRDYGCRNAKGVKDHRTGRKCPNPGCGGEFRDTIINFGENCNDAIFTLGVHNHAIADLCVVAGTSCRLGHVTPMPISVRQNGGDLVMINL